MKKEKRLARSELFAPDKARDMRVFWNCAAVFAACVGVALFVMVVQRAG
jgi:hypothetical protein